jgi:hypothetical protein
MPNVAETFPGDVDTFEKYKLRSEDRLPGESSG